MGRGWRGNGLCLLVSQETIWTWLPLSGICSSGSKEAIPWNVSGEGMHLDFDALSLLAIN